MSVEPAMPSNHLILCRPFLLLPSIFPSIRVFSNESSLHIMQPKYQSFSFSLSPSNEYSGLIYFSIDWLDLLAVLGTLNSLLQHRSSKSSNFSSQLSLWSNSSLAVQTFLKTYINLLKKWVLKFCNTLLRLCWWLSSKDSAFNTGDTGYAGLVPRSGRSPGGGYDHPLQHSCLENHMDRGAW